MQLGTLSAVLFSTTQWIRRRHCLEVHNTMLIQFLVVITAFSGAESLDCVSCQSIADPHLCNNTNTCSDHQVCFLEKVGNVYNMGCTIYEHCGGVASPSIVGRGVSGQRAPFSCNECCSTDGCNADLCSHLMPTMCVDDESVDCAKMNSLFQICTDIHKAKLVCPQFCNLCTLVDGNWSDWSQWGGCDVTCDTGLQVRSRTCTDPKPVHGGLDCVGNSTEAKVCTKNPCPVHGGWGSWLSWGACSKTCGFGLQNRNRLCDNPHPDRFGDNCYGIPIESKICLPGACLDGGWSDWGRWSDCTESCGGGIRSKTRTCSNPTPSLLGKQCEGSSETFGLCNKQTCPDKKVSFIAAGVNVTRSGQNLVFPTVISNYGNGYNATTGRFTCKIPGMYYFGATLSKSWANTDYTICYLCLNSQKKIGTQQSPHTGDRTDAYGLSISGAFYLDTNDIVDICSCHGTGALETDQRTSFTGILVTADN